jgi:hypothetical protein
VVLVADGRDSLVEADHPPDEETQFLSGTQSGTPTTPMHTLLAERAGLTRWPKAIASLENQIADATRYIPEGKKTTRRGGI